MQGNVAAKTLNTVTTHAAATTWTLNVRRTTIAVAAPTVVAATARAARQQEGDSIETVLT